MALRFFTLIALVWAGIVGAWALPSWNTLSAPSWVIPGTIADFDFANQRYWQSGQISSFIQLFSYSRNANAWIDNQAGIWTLFPPAAARVTDKGFLSELAATDTALWNRDMTNVVWTASNVTTAETATGIDGIANNATTLTATGANGTVLQTVTQASAANVYSVFLKRRTGTGNIDITIDNGTTWTTAAVTSTYTRFQVIKTAANPTVGIRIVASGDAVDVDFNQLESGSNATSPFKTTTVANTRSADVLTWRNAIPMSAQSGVVYVELQEPQTALPTVNYDIFQIRVDSSNSIVGAVTASTAKPILTATSAGVGTFTSGTATNGMALNGIYRATFSYAVNNFAVAYSSSIQTTAVTQTSAAAVPVGDATGFGIGGSATGVIQCGCYIRRLAYGTVPVQASQLLNWAQAQ